MKNNINPELLYKIKKPDTQLSVPDSFMIWSDLIERKIGLPFDDYSCVGKYLSFEEVSRRSPPSVPCDDFWAIVRARRLTTSKNTPIKDEKSGMYFTLSDLVGLDEFLHELDLHYGGNIAGVQLNRSERSSLSLRSLIEEAIASSQIEGASTEKHYAEKMIRQKLKPKTPDEQMILNNYTTLSDISLNYKDRPMSKELLFELHKSLTNKTIEESEVGRFRKDSDDIVVQDKITGIIYHIPPSEKFLNDEIEEFIKFANDNGNNSKYMHPFVRASIIHFWIAYLHPFTDGNGRLARALFSWYLLRKEYWSFAVLPISRIIKNGRKSYDDSFCNTEQDDLDFTYFLSYITNATKKATNDVKKFIEDRAKLEDVVSSRLAINEGLNQRQSFLLARILTGDDTPITINTYLQLHSISRPTAHLDLNELVSKNYLKENKIKKTIYYIPQLDNIEKLRI